MSDESNVVVRRRKLSDYSQDQRNANAGSQRGGHLIAESLQKTGAHRSLVADKNGVLVAGNKTSEGAAEVGIEDVIEIETDGKALVVVKRTDFDLNDPDPNNIARKAAYFDNQAALQSITWDAEQIMTDIADGIDMDDWFLDDEIAEIIKTAEENEQGDNNYSRKIEAPIYEPNREKPAIDQLYDDTYTRQLIEEIDATDELSEQEKDFLKLAAMRHTRLNFSKIADFYAHSSPAIQRLMENSALVIIDFDRAIEQGFVQLSTRLAALVGEEYE